MMDAGQLNILVIDDDDGMRRLLIDIITGRGHQAIPADSAEARLPARSPGGSDQVGAGSAGTGEGFMID